MMDRATVRPPTPESKTPIGELSVTLPTLPLHSSTQACSSPHQECDRSYQEPPERAGFGSLAFRGPSALATRYAASTPPIAPKRWACQDTVTTPVMSATATVTM